ncbi:hypothetical protein JOE31_000193 [Arthrobacter sp. PvP023]|uniref:hypothetical protein n=1 Tax=Micrococcaceae TaxID=1268 RepID=UPI001B75C038|nr:hypothetical protein [Arthrobacter sp. PvP023]MBP1133961.1 hypothetical protein [Arthrobacter sp. PvP023]
MDETIANETVVNPLIACINDRHIEVMDELFHDDALMHWPHCQRNGLLERGIRSAGMARPVG